MRPTNTDNLYPNFSMTKTEARMERWMWQIMALLAVIITVLAGIGLVDVITAVQSWL